MLEGLQKRLNKESLGEATALQCLFRDDNSVVFRRLPIEHTCLVEKKDEKVRRAWKHNYQTQYPFNGYKGLPSGMVTLAFERDIILDPHHILSDSEKPDTEDITDMKRFKDIAAARRRQIANKRGETLLIDKLTIFLGIGFALEILAIILKVVLH